MFEVESILLGKDDADLGSSLYECSRCLIKIAGFQNTVSILELRKLFMIVYPDSHLSRGWRPFPICIEESFPVPVLLPK